MKNEGNSITGDEGDVLGEVIREIIFEQPEMEAGLRAFLRDLSLAVSDSPQSPSPGVGTVRRRKSDLVC